jgi:hypothetical protein
MKKIFEMKLDEISHKTLNKPYPNAFDRVDGEERRLVCPGPRVRLLVSRSEETQGAYMARCGKGWVDILVRVGSLYIMSMSLYRTKTNELQSQPLDPTI